LYRVALLIETSKAFGRGLLLGVGRYARLHGQWSTYVDERGLADPVPAWLESGEFDGIIARAAQRETLDHVTSFGIPTICLGEENPADAISVVNDDARCAELAAQHLMDRQFRNFGFLGHAGLVWSDARRDHYLKCLTTAGMKCEVLESSVDSTPGAPWYQRRERLASWITSLPKPVGILACYDAAARTILEICRDLNLLVPEQVAVIGVDNDEVLCDLCDPPLTSIAPDTETIGMEAARLLDQLMGQSRAKNIARQATAIVVPPRGIMTRGSTDTQAINDSMIAPVVGYIRKHACDGIDVTDLLTEFPMSRRTLERRFSKALNQSPLELIRHVRINHVKTLLRETDLKLDAISELAGFSYTPYMVGQFHQLEGKTPGQYRRLSTRNA